MTIAVQNIAQRKQLFQQSITHKGEGRDGLTLGARLILFAVAASATFSGTTASCSMALVLCQSQPEKGVT
ncbi:MAG: hypothetical protein P8J37_05690 [Fuerstiella sp.]|nr:hypothetical protein [Fuerstiella sp.]